MGVPIAARFFPGAQRLTHNYMFPKFQIWLRAAENQTVKLSLSSQMPSKVPDLDKTLFFLHREILNYSYLLFLFTHKTKKLPFQISVQRDSNNCWVPLCGTILFSLKPLSVLSRPLGNAIGPMTWNSTPSGGSSPRRQSRCQETAASWVYW